MGTPLLPGLVALLFMSGMATPLPTPLPGSLLFPVSPAAVQLLPSGREFERVELQQLFVYAGTTYSHLYINMDGYVLFSIANINDQTSRWFEVPNPQLGKNIIAPLWTDLIVNQAGIWTYEQATKGSLIQQATHAINIIFPDTDFSASWVFVSTWQNVPLEWSSGVASFQVVLVSDGGGRCYALMNYASVPSIPFTFWLAGFDVENSDFITIAVDDSSQLSSTSNVKIPGCWAFPVSNLHTGTPVPENFYPFWHGTKVDPTNSRSSRITLQRAFQYFEAYVNTIFVNTNGVLSFSEPLHAADIYANHTDLIAPLWTNFEPDSGKVTYQEVSGGPLLSRATKDVNTMFPGNGFYATWIFIATWEMVSFLNTTESATFQSVLISNGADVSYVLMNYGHIHSTTQAWLAGYKATHGRYNFIPEADTVKLSSTSNVHVPGRWAFKIGSPATSPCQLMKCAWNEVCKMINGVYGCGCGENNPADTNADIYGASKTCSGSTGSLSMSLCQLFESGYSANVLHLNDPNCKGEVQNDRLVFEFDANAKTCGTALTNNGTHIIFENNVGTTDGLVSRVGGLNIAFSCVYPLIQNISMPLSIEASTSLVSRKVSTEGSYAISMIQYPDPSFSLQNSGNVMQEMTQQVYIAVEVDKFDGKQIALVLDNCWVTPVNWINFPFRRDLIINAFPNPAQRTVEVFQNGVSTSSRFSFKMFTFTNIYLHCQLHLCLLQSGTCNAMEPSREDADFSVDLL